jgi:hypothetical protein
MRPIVSLIALSALAVNCAAFAPTRSKFCFKIVVRKGCQEISPEWHEVLFDVVQFITNFHLFVVLNNT